MIAAGTFTEVLQTNIPDCVSMVNVRVKLCVPAVIETVCWPFGALIVAPLFTDHTHVSPAAGALSAVKLLVLPLQTVLLVPPVTMGQVPPPALTLTEQFEVAEQPVILLVTVTVKLTLPPASAATAV